MRQTPTTPNFPFPGNGDYPGNGNPPPFEPAASIDQWILYILVIIAVVALIIFINRSLETKRGMKIIKAKKNSQSYNRAMRRRRERQILKDLNKER